MSNSTSTGTTPPSPAEPPSFAVVGRVNAGKSATLATLLEIDEDHLLRVSPTPGETTQVQTFPFRYGSEELIRFLDTPGFQRPVEALQRLRDLAAPHAPTPATLETFVHTATRDFPDECLLLQPILQGAGILYVVDPSRPLRETFLAEIEILRLTGRPRLALLNPQSDPPPEHLEAWRRQLGTAFNLVRTFNAHHARYPERRHLLESLLQIDEPHTRAIRSVLHAMDQEIADRREQAADELMSFLEKALALRASEPLEPSSHRRDSIRAQQLERLQQHYASLLASLEQDLLTRLLHLYRHHLLSADADPSLHLGLNLSSRETWKKWGLSRWQLATAGALTGGAAGAAFDLGVGIHSLGAGSVLGALVGGSAAYLKGGSLPSLRIHPLKGLELSPGEGRQLAVGPPAHPNFPWILLDSILIRHSHILSRAHGRRDHATLAAHPSSSPLSRKLPQKSRNLLQKWFNSCLKQSPDRDLEPAVLQQLIELLAQLESREILPHN